MNPKTKTVLALLLCEVAAGCSQTTNQASGMQPSQQQATATSARRATPEQRCQDAIEKSMKARQNAAAAGSILSVVGGLGGFGGRGGAIVGQAASVGGSIMQSQAQNSAENAAIEECR